jgi:hypothetical protein
MTIATFSFYNVVLFVHISAAVIAFGVTFAYPILGIFIARNAPRSLPALHRAQARIGKLLITPAATVLLAAGIYLAAQGPYKFSSVWIGGGLVIIVVLLGLGGAFFAPSEQRAAELAERDIAAAPAGGEVTFSAAYEAVQRRVAMVGALASTLVLVAIFLMTIKPGSKLS